MTTKPWTIEEDNILLSHYEPDPGSKPLGMDDVLVSLPSRTYKAVYSRYKRIKVLRTKLQECVPKSLPTIKLPTEEERTKENWEKLKKFFNEEVTKSAKLEPRGLVDGEVKILSMSDWHIPFHRAELVEEILEEHGDADAVVVNGDFLDMYGVSSYTKHKHIPLMDEYKIGLEMVARLSSMFPKVFLTRGNHENRLSRIMRSQLPLETKGFFATNVTAMLANGILIDKNGLAGESLDFPNVYHDPHLPWGCLIGKTLFAHPHPFRKGPGRTVEYVHKQLEGGHLDYDAIVLGHCFDAETELLTKEGWQSIDSIDEKHQAVTFNLDTEELEFNHIKAIYKYNDYDKLIHFTNKDGLEIAVTEDHGMVGRSTNACNWQKKKAKNFFNKKFYIPAAGEETSTKDAGISDNLLRLLAWVVTEGHITWTNKDQTNAYIRISQSQDKNEYVTYLEELLQKENFSYSKSQRYVANSVKHNQHRNYDAYRFGLGVKDTPRLMKFLTKDKVFKQSLLGQLSLRQRKLLIEELCKGDGSKCGSESWRAYYTKNPELKDQFQYLATLAGYRTKASIRDDGVFVIHLSYQNVRQVTKTEVKPYSGKVFCVSVPNGTLVARRNGVVFVTQNTHHCAKYIYEGMLLMEQGCLSGLHGYQTSPNLGYKAQVNGYAVVYQDKDGNTDYNKSRVYYRGIQKAYKTHSAVAKD